MKNPFNSIGLLLLFSLLACVVVAQENNQASNQTQSTDFAATDDRGQAILNAFEQLNTLRTELYDLESKFINSSGEEKEAIALQRQEKYQLLVNKLRDFGSLTKAYKDDGGNLNTLLEVHRDDILATGGVIRQQIDTYRETLESASDTRDTLTQEGLRGYIIDSELVDLAYSLLVEYVGIVENIDFDPALSRDYLLEHIPGRAEFLIRRIQLSTQRQTEYNKTLSTQSDDADTKALLALVEEKLAKDIASLRLTIDIADKIGIDTSKYQTEIVRATGKIGSEVLNTQVATELFSEWWLEVKNYLRVNFIGAFFKVVVFLLILLIFRFLATLTKKVIRKSVRSSRMHLSMLLQNILVSWISRAVMLVGLLVALSQLGISLGPLLAGLGVAGFIVGFALQDTLGNFASGMMILIYRPFDVGDVVEAGGAFGKVKSMSIVSTTILTFDHQTLIIPNSKIWGDVIKNVTAQRERRVDMVFGIGYGDDIPKAEKILADIVSSHPKVLSQPEPIIKLHTLGESSVDFVVRPWCKTDDYWDVYWDITREVKMRFDAEGVSIPFPQRDVHVYQAKPT